MLLLPLQVHSALLDLLVVDGLHVLQKVDALQDVNGELAYRAELKIVVDVFVVIFGYYLLYVIVFSFSFFHFILSSFGAVVGKYHLGAGQRSREGRHQVA